MGVVDNIIEAVLPVMPDERFAAFKIEAPTAFAVESVNRGNNFLKVQVFLAASNHPAMLTPQVTAVGENQPADERHGLPEKMVADNVFQTVQ